MIKITRIQLRRIISEAMGNEPQIGDRYSTVRQTRSPGSYSPYREAEVVGFGRGPLGKTVIVKSLVDPSASKFDIPMPAFKKQFRKIIKESLLNEQEMIPIVVNEYEDVEDINILANYALRNDMQGALKDKDLQYYIDKNEADMLVDDSMGWLKHVGSEDKNNMPAPAGWNLDKIYTFFSKFSDAAYEVYDKKAKAASASAPNRAERKAIGRAFTYDDVSEDEIASITFQLRRKGGKVVNINMEDHDDQLGNMTTGMSSEFAAGHGTTLDKVEKTLRDGGAKERKKQKPVKRSTPYYD